MNAASLQAPVGGSPSGRCPCERIDQPERASGAGEHTRATALSEAAARRLGRAAVAALYEELALAPKPGLVSFEDSGSHSDMDAGTFLRSLFALRHSYARLAALGASGADFTALVREGQAAEVRMLAATGGINTHRGAIFTLGLLCASAGALLVVGETLRPSALRSTLVTRWGPALAARDGVSLRASAVASACASASHGAAAAQAHALRGANAEAAAGLPVLFDIALPALQQTLAAGLPERAARLQCFFATLAVLDDTNVAHRGGLTGLRWAQAQAQAWLDAGGAHAPDAVARAQGIHRAFVQRRLSPGGAADLLAASCWLQRVCVPA